jgi:hypothetical protein
MTSTPCLIYVRSKYWVGKTDAVRQGQVEVNDDEKSAYYNSRCVCVPLYRKYDGSAEAMRGFFGSFAEKVKRMFPKDVVLPSTEWLTYAEDMSAMLIAHDYENTMALIKSGQPVQPRPDLRAMGEINDSAVQNIYVMDLQDIGDVWSQDRKARKSVRMRVRHYQLVPSTTMHDKLIRGYDAPSGACDWEEKYLLYEPPITVVESGRVEQAVERMNDAGR